MTIDANVSRLRSERQASGLASIPNSLQGVTNDRIREVLVKLRLAGEDIVDATFALLDNETPSLFNQAPPGSKFCEGASTAHIGAHIGILQRGGNARIDREGRDYWIKPLRELGAINPVYLNPASRSFIPGHPKAKSPNSAYILADEFVAILRAPQPQSDELLSEWTQVNKIRQRARAQGIAQKVSVETVKPDHLSLIRACAEIYVPRFLPGYTLLFADYEDGQRVTDEERINLARAGIELTLDDPMPDLLLWNPESDTIWIIEAVTTDGEVSEHKVAQTLNLVRRSDKSGAGFTTAYFSWRSATRRQSQLLNIPPATYIWIREDPSKQFLILETDPHLTIQRFNKAHGSV